MDNMTIIAGLGNPGTEYDGTRHNVGFEVLDLLAAQWKSPIKKIKFHSLYALCKRDYGRVLLLKPQTYMNESGRALQQAMSFYKVPPARVLVVLDDINLPTGKLRLRESGSDGGHKGLINILYQLQTEQFPRLRIGVGAPPDRSNGINNWVLGGYTPEERKLVDAAVINAAKAVEVFCEKGFAIAANRVGEMGQGT